VELDIFPFTTSYNFQYVTLDFGNYNFQGKRERDEAHKKFRLQKKNFLFTFILPDKMPQDKKSNEQSIRVGMINVLRCTGHCCHFTYYN
jgi:hypothetical protein